MPHFPFSTTKKEDIEGKENTLQGVQKQKTCDEIGST